MTEQLKKPIVIKMVGNSDDRLWTTKGFTKYIHNPSDDEVKNIRTAEIGLMKFIGKAMRTIPNLGEVRFRSLVTEGESGGIFLTVPAEALPKLKSKTREAVNIVVTVRGINIITKDSENSVRPAYVNYSTEYSVTESESLDLDFEDDDE